jgi:hypothetical protein
MRVRSSLPSGEVELRCARSSSDASEQDRAPMLDGDLRMPAGGQLELFARAAGGRQSPPPASGATAEEDFNLKSDFKP